MRHQVGFVHFVFLRQLQYVFVGKHQAFRWILLGFCLARRVILLQHFHKVLFKLRHDLLFAELSNGSRGGVHRVTASSIVNIFGVSCLRRQCNVCNFFHVCSRNNTVDQLFPILQRVPLYIHTHYLKVLQLGRFCPFFLLFF